jgi:hypothetical protein
MSLIFLVFLFSSCSKKKIVKLEVDITTDSTSLKRDKSNILISFYEASASTIKYKNINAISYAKKYAALNNNSCGIYNNNPSANLSDCAHFISHSLSNGGIEIKAQNPDYSICKDGLCYRVAELTSALENLSKSYNNVQQISIDDAIIGDYGFFKIPVVKPTHAFMICQPAANTDDITIYAHTTNRSCSKPEPSWYQFFGAAYRITDAN